MTRTTKHAESQVVEVRAKHRIKARLCDTIEAGDVEPVDKGGDSRLGVPHSLLRRTQVANYHHPFDFLQGATCV